MAIGPMQVAGIAGFRSVAPFAYANPFNGGVLSWIGDPTNEWSIVSYALVAIILGSSVWLVSGAVTFFESQMITATLTAAMYIGVLIILAEGGKFDPTEYKEIMTAGLFGLAFFSTCGRVFSTTDDQKDKKKA